MIDLSFFVTAIALFFGLVLSLLPRLIREHRANENGYRPARQAFIVVVVGWAVVTLASIVFSILGYFGLFNDATSLQIGKVISTSGRMCVIVGGWLLLRFRVMS